MIEFFVPGMARAAGSKTARWAGGKMRVTHAGKFTKSWMDTVRWFGLKEYGQRRVLLAGPIKLTLTFFRSRPKGHYGTGRNEGILKERYVGAMPTSAPDLTKLTRAVEDGLTGLVWKDDSQVVQQDTRKVYCDPPQIAGVCVEIASVEG